MIPELRDGIQPAHAERRLRETATQGRNLVGSSAGQAVAIHQNNFLAWVGIAETQLRNVFSDPIAWERLYDERHWQIYGLTQASPRAIELMNTAATVQAAWLDELADRLKRLADRLVAAPGQLTVVDTHVLLHFLPPDQIDWPVVVGKPTVRLVLPLRVVEELDEKKYTARDDLADRARRLLSQLRTQLAPTAGAPTSLRTGVTIEVPVDDGPRQRTVDADQEILDTCRELKSGGGPVVLVTDDTGVNLRASSAGIQVIPMPEQYLRRKPQPGDQAS
ncbi:MAG: PIN domain-containing protein [Solirubrobacteraceae bacterium]